MNVSQQTGGTDRHDPTAPDAVEDFRTVASWLALTGKAGESPLTTSLDSAAPGKVRAAHERIRRLSAANLMFGSPPPDPVSELDGFFTGLPERERVIAFGRILTLHKDTQRALGLDLNLSPSRIGQLETRIGAKAHSRLGKQSAGVLMTAVCGAVTAPMPLEELTARFPVLLHELDVAPVPLWLVIGNLTRKWEKCGGRLHPLW